MRMYAKSSLPAITLQVDVSEQKKKKKKNWADSVYESWQVTEIS